MREGHGDALELFQQLGKLITCTPQVLGKAAIEHKNWTISRFRDGFRIKKKKLSGKLAESFFLPGRSCLKYGLRLLFLVLVDAA
jgi:hypothetical protein